MQQCAIAFGHWAWGVTGIRNLQRQKAPILPEVTNPESALHHFFWIMYYIYVSLAGQRCIETRFCLYL